MNSNSLHPVMPGRLLFEPTWKQQFGEWCDLLALCARKPSRKRVHGLRSLTLRLSVVLKSLHREQPLEASALRAFKRWSKEGKKLRRALEPVRDVDVYMARLSGLRHALLDETAGEPRLSPQCQREMDRLESHLKQQRRKAVEDLVDAMGARRKRLERLGREMEACRIPEATGPTAQRAMRIFAGLAERLPGLDSANLHAFRKQLKKALYLAVFSAPSDPAAGRLAAAARKMHSATGEWHDWQTLAIEARRILPAREKHEGVVGMLEQQAEEALSRALKVCRRTVVGYLKSAAGARPVQQRKPVVSVSDGRSYSDHNGKDLAGWLIA